MSARTTAEAGAVDASAPPADARTPKAWLWIEFLTLFVGVPVAMATVLEPRYFFPMLGGASLLGLVLLALTPGFRWRSLIEGPILPHWRMALIFIIGSALLVSALTLWLRPWAFLAMPVERTSLWLVILTFYPFVSALPQELLYRTLYFERYGGLFGESAGGRRLAIVMNGALFGLAHAFYWNWVAVGLTFIAGIFFADAYANRRSFGLAWLLHAVGGLLIFTIGLGAFFYHGAAPR